MGNEENKVRASDSRDRQPTCGPLFAGFRDCRGRWSVSALRSGCNTQCKNDIVNLTALERRETYTRIYDESTTCMIMMSVAFLLSSRQRAPALK